jgi:hypothetical protein
MKHLIILFLAGFSFGILFAQQPNETDKRALEREIKVSGDYLYGEAICNTKEEAIEMAKIALVSEINKEVMNHPGWQFTRPVQVKDVEPNINIIDLMRGSKFRIITYVRKDNITIVLNNKTQENKLPNETEKPKETRSVIQEQKIQTASVPEKKLSAPVVSNYNDTNNLLDQIVAATSMPEIRKILDTSKRKGKVVSGTIDTLTTPEKAYLIVYKTTGEIVAILDKGSDTNRKDLISGEIKGKEIQTQNQVIWFILF